MRVRVAVPAWVFVAVSSIVGAQAPSAPPASAPPMPVGRAFELDLLGGLFVHRTANVALFEDERIDADVAGGVSGGLRLRIPIASGRWGVLVGGTVSRTGTAYAGQDTDVFVSVQNGQPARGPGAVTTHAVAYADLTVGVERRWAMGRSTALLTSVEVGYARHRSRLQRCTDPPVVPALGGCGGVAGGEVRGVGAFDSWTYAAIIPAVGVAQRVAPEVALTALVRPSFLVGGVALDGIWRTAPVSVMVGLRVGAGEQRP